MFGWFKKKGKQELLKLFFQNQNACAYLASYFETAGDLAGSAEIDGWLAEVDEIFSNLGTDGFPSPELHSRLLQINMACRRAYDQTAGRYIRSFDDSFIPIGGWQAYYSRHENI